MQVMTHLEAGTFLGILLVIAVVVSLVWFSRATSDRAPAYAAGPDVPVRLVGRRDVQLRA